MNQIKKKRGEKANDNSIKHTEWIPRQRGVIKSLFSGLRKRGVFVDFYKMSAKENYKHKELLFYFTTFGLAVFAETANLRPIL